MTTGTWSAGIMLVTCIAVLGRAADPDSPPRLKRSESFLGIHFDLHAGEDCTEMGKHTTPAMINNIIDLVGPDYLQIDCKGHPGVSSYPTKVGHPAPGFVGDPLRVWRDVTARRGVALYMHYSGVWDSHAVKTHPDWAAVNADGSIHERVTSLFGPYVDRLLIPQLRELAGEYGVDGAWVDGECWAAVPDYSDAAIAAFRETTGIADIPRKPADPHWFEFLEFHRQAFRDYLNYYIAEVKKTHPEFQICSNWAFTDHMPEAVCVPVDFLSGDYSPQDSVNSARLSARFLARQGKPWDLMAWSFSTQPDQRQKSAVQLQREAAIVVALGGGFQAYFKQKRDGSIYDEQMPVMAEVARFCRARQTLCHRAEMVPQIALVFSTAAHYRRINGLFHRDHATLDGALRALLESQHSVEIQTESQLAGRLSEYPLIIVPEWEYLEPSFKRDLTSYVETGGNLLLIGPVTARLFGDELAVRPDSPPTNVTQLGRGRIAAVYVSFGREYCQTPSDEARAFLDALVRHLFPEPLVEVSGSPDVDVCVARQDGKLLVNLVNTSGPHRTQSILESISPVGPLVVRIRRASAPTRVTLEPAGDPLEFDYRDGLLQVTVPPVAIHDIVVVEP